MVITYQGLQCFKVQFGEVVLAFDPISKNSKFKATSFGADVTLVSNNHPDMNGIEQTSRGDKQTFVVAGPGEYEINGVFIKASSSKTSYGGEDRINTIYNVSLEGMNLCFVGALGSLDLSSDTKEQIENVDILFVPISGEGVLSPSDAYKFAVSLEPSVIIPMNYEEKSLKIFLKEGGQEGTKPIEKLTIKKKDLEDKEGEIVVLESQ